jgi:AcrR family transcriptional regulator
MRIGVRGDIREVILDAVGDLLERYGFRKMTVDDIAREVGIGKGTVYLHFSSKEDIALSWMDRSNLHLQEELRAIRSSDGTPLERIREMLIARVMFRFDAAQNFREGLDELFRAMRKEFLVRRAQYHAAEACIFCEVLEAGCRSGELVAENCRAVAETLLLATNSLLPYSLSAVQLGNRDEIEAKAAGIADLVLKGLIRR